MIIFALLLERQKENDFFSCDVMIRRDIFWVRAGVRAGHRNSTDNFDDFFILGYIEKRDNAKIDARGAKKRISGQGPLKVS